MSEYILYCDESVGKGKKYGDFFGGCIVSSKDLKYTIETLEKCKTDNNLFGEIKWTKATELYLEKYINVVDCFFSLIREGKIKVRIMFRKMTDQYEAESKNDKYFKLYYQFIKHSFGLRSLTDSEPINLRIYLDQMPAKKEDKHLFKQYLKDMPKTLDYKNGSVIIPADQIAEINSHDHVLLQCVDIVMGAMQFRLNDLHLEKPVGEKRRGKRTIAKEKLYKHIYQQICLIHPYFNIGISTGSRDYKNPHWESPYEHWLFEHKKTELTEE